MKIRYLNIFFSIVFSAILIYFLFKELNESEISIKDIFYNINLKYLLAYLLLSFSGLFIRAYRYLVLLNGLSENDEEKPSFPKLIIVTAIRNALVDMFPARLGEASFFYVLKSYGIELSRTLSVFALCLALDIVVLAGIFLFALIYLIVNGTSLFEISNLGFIFFGVLTAALVAAVYYADFFINFALSVSRKSKFLDKGFLKSLKQKIENLLEKLKGDFLKLRNLGFYPKLFTTTILLRIAKYLSLYFLLISITLQFGQGPTLINPVISSISFILAEATASLPTSGLFGFGAYEGAWSIIMKLGEIELKSPLSVAFSVHLITQIVGYITGVIALVFFALKLQKIKGNLGFVRGNIKQERGAKNSS